MRSFAQLTLILILAAFAGCDSFIPALGGNSDIVLSITLPDHTRVERAQALSKTLAIITVTVTVTGDDMDEVTADLDVSGSTASGTVEVPKGLDRTFSVECFDASGIVQYSGEATADIEEPTAQVDITTEGHFPTGSTLSVDGYNSEDVVVSWSKSNDNDFNSYELVRAASSTEISSSSTRTRLGTYTSHTTLSYTDTTVEQNSAYFYAVVVWDTEGLGTRSASRGVITPRFMSSTIGPVTIPDLGSNGIYFLDNSFAPSDAVVTFVNYHIRVDDAGNPNAFWTSDYKIYVSSNSAALAIADVLVWDNEGLQTDNGDDDDDADDSDIWLYWRSTSLFNGESPNQYWGVYVEDTFSGDSGVLDYIELEIYYTSASLLKRDTSVTGKATIAFNRGTGWTIDSQVEEGLRTALTTDAIQNGADLLPASSVFKRIKN